MIITKLGYMYMQATRWIRGVEYVCGLLSMQLQPEPKMHYTNIYSTGRLEERP